MKGGMSIMRIGVIDSDAIFQHPFFYGKKIEIKRMNPGYCIKNKNFPFAVVYLEITKIQEIVIYLLKLTVNLLDM